MAIWQYAFYLLPKENVIGFSEGLESEFSDQEFDDEKFWLKTPHKRNIFYDLEGVLPKKSSWNSKIDLYGDIETNCIEVLFNNEFYVVSIMLRLDFSKDYKIILNDIINYCKLKGLVIISEELKLLTLKYEEVDNAIRKSKQLESYISFVKKLNL